MSENENLYPRKAEKRHANELARKIREADKPSSIRAAAEKAIKRLSQMVFGPSDLSAIHVVEQAIRDAVERERERCIRECDTVAAKGASCRCVVDICIDRIRKEE